MPIVPGSSLLELSGKHEERRLVAVASSELYADRQAVGRTLRGTVVREHSVDTWADRVVELAG